MKIDMIEIVSSYRLHSVRLLLSFVYVALEDAPDENEKSKRKCNQTDDARSKKKCRTQLKKEKKNRRM